MPTEKIVVENNETANLSYLMEDITSLYKEMGSLLKRLGEIEKKNPDIMEKMKQFSSPEVLERFVENVPPETLGKFFRIFIRMAKFSEVKDAMSLPADAKIELGEEMHRVSQDLLDILKKIDEIKKERK